MDARRVIALLRVSSEAQAGSERAGISRQREAVEAIASAHGLLVVETVELHVSGASVREEPAYQRMLQRLSEPAIAGVVVAEFSRLLRPEEPDDYAVLGAFQRAGKVLWTPEGPRNMREFSGRLLSVLQGELAAYERQQIRERTAAGRAKLRRAGHKAEANGLPRGCSYDFAARRWRYLEPEASRVREAFAAVLSGVTNLAEIGRRAGWTRGSWAAANVLRQPLYAGTYHGVPAPGLDPPLVSPADWHAVQAILAARRAQRRPRTSGDETGAVYAGHLVCGRCGAALWTLPPRTDQPGFARYLCAHARDQRCPMGSLSARLADPVIDAELERRLGSETALRALLELADAEDALRGASRVADLERQRAALHNRRQARLRQHEMGALDDRELRKALTTLDAERAAIEAAQDRAGREIAVDPEAVEAVVRAFCRWRDLAVPMRRSLLRDLQITVTISRPRPRRVRVEGVECRAITR